MAKTRGISPARRHFVALGLMLFSRFRWRQA